jgi:hypothetical protein
VQVLEVRARAKQLKKDLNTQQIQLGDDQVSEGQPTLMSGQAGPGPHESATIMMCPRC